jgi:hypothetical protein
LAPPGFVVTRYASGLEHPRWLYPLANRDVLVAESATEPRAPKSLMERAQFEAASEYFGLGLPAARTIIKDVAAATASWREVAREVGARPAEITRMASAFEHDDLSRALAL